MMRKAALFLFTWLAGCAQPYANIEADGQWADGTPIHFERNAYIDRRGDGRIELSSYLTYTAHFMGLRIVYDPEKIPAPGSYSVDPLPKGKMEIYTAQTPDGTRDSDVVPPATILEREASEGAITLDALPGPDGGKLLGSFQTVRITGKSAVLILTLGRGTFRAEL